MLGVNQQERYYKQIVKSLKYDIITLSNLKILWFNTISQRNYLEGVE